MQKRIALGFALGLGAGALYHHSHKETPIAHDSLYKVVTRAKEKINEALDPDSELHAKLAKACRKAVAGAGELGAKVKVEAKQQAAEVKRKAKKHRG